MINKLVRSSSFRTRFFGVVIHSYPHNANVMKPLNGVHVVNV